MSEVQRTVESVIADIDLLQQKKENAAIVWGIFKHHLPDSAKVNLKDYIHVLSVYFRLDGGLR